MVVHPSADVLLFVNEFQLEGRVVVVNAHIPRHLLSAGYLLDDFLLLVGVLPCRVGLVGSVCVVVDCKVPESLHPADTDYPAVSVAGRTEEGLRRRVGLDERLVHHRENVAFVLVDVLNSLLLRPVVRITALYLVQGYIHEVSAEMHVLPSHIHRIRVLEIAMVVYRLEMRHRLAEHRIVCVARIVNAGARNEEGLILTRVPLPGVVVAQHVVELDAHLVRSLLSALVARINHGLVRSVPVLAKDITHDRSDEVVLERRTSLALDVLLLRDSLDAPAAVLDFHVVSPLLAFIVAGTSVRLLAIGPHGVLALSGVGDDVQGVLRADELVPGELGHTVDTLACLRLRGPARP